MRWNKNYDRDGSVRIEKIFLFTPDCMDGEWMWMEWVYVKQVYSIGMGWVNAEWSDKEEFIYYKKSLKNKDVSKNLKNETIYKNSSNTTSQDTTKWLHD